MAKMAANLASAALPGELEVAQAVLAWRATDGFNASYPPFTGGIAVGQWRPTPPAFGPMSAQAWHSPQCSFSIATLSSGLDHRECLPAPPIRTISMLSRRSVAISDRRALQTRLRSLHSGRETPARTGIRQPTRSRVITTCQCPTATGSSRS